MLVDEPLWYKDAIIYELHVRSFHDGIGDGMGDFAGLAKKIDYLQDLGVTAVWLLPFYPSPLRDDGYDIADYSDIHPHYGKLKDFQEFLEAAHDRGIRVITELVINHTSDRHPWFQRARRAPVGSAERDFYVWSDTQDKYKEARIIFKDFENSNWTWDPVANAYYWHRFYSHQPDLNYDNPAVWNAIFPLVDFWLGMGVDGMRLDAVPYLYERDGTSCENLPETHVFLKALRKHIDERFPNRMLLAEANQWPEDSAAYFGNGDESNMAFHFPLMPRMFMAIHMEDRYPILDIMAQTPAIPENSQWCLFLRNHDELTLEMVTDEERDYMYRAYASESRARINLGIRRRLAPLLGNNRRKIELMNGLLFSLPGTPVLYYGDEIGMGDNIYLGDRNGVRTPMQWSADRNGGFSRANPQKLFLPVVIDPEYHYEALNVEAQQNNPSSLLWWMKRLIALRKRHKAFGRGTLEFLQPGNRKILAFLRRYENECILVVANLSRFVQHADLDLAGLQGLIPIELFGRNPFPRIGKQTYPLTLGPHAFYWFTLETPKDSRSNDLSPAEQKQLPLITSFGGWEELFRTPGKERLEEALAEYLQKRHWAGDAGRIKTSIVREAFHIRYGEVVAYVCRVEVEYFDRPSRMILVPLTLAQGELQQHITANSPRAIVARLRGSDEGILFDAVDHAEFGNAVLRAIAEGKRYSVGAGEYHAQTFTSFNVLDKDQRPFAPCVCSEEQTNTSIIFGESLVLKIFRSIEEGVHPEVEIGRYLTERTKFTHCAPLLGVVEYVRRKSEPITLAVLHAHVANEGTAWQYSLDELSRYFERVLSLPPEEQQLLLVPNKPVAAPNDDAPAVIREMIGRYLESVRILGKRTGEFHLALGAEKDDPAFTPEPFTELYKRSVYQSMRNSHRRAMDRLQDALPGLHPSAKADAHRVLDRAGSLLSRFHSLLHGKFTAQRIRCHGDLNLCEVLYTGKDFAFIDFEGDTDRSLSDRRVKRAALRDVASMIRSFHYAAFSALHGDLNSRGRTPGMIRPEDVSILMPWAKTWYTWVSANYLTAYLETTDGAFFLPHTRAETEALLSAFLLEKSLTELHHELSYRPPWVGIPLQGLLQLLDDEN